MTHAHARRVRVMDIYDYMNSKTLFRTVRYESRFEKHVPVMVHVNYHPDKYERLQSVWKKYVEGDVHALDHYPIGGRRRTRRPGGAGEARVATRSLHADWHKQGAMCACAGAGWRLPAFTRSLRSLTCRFQLLSASPSKQAALLASHGQGLQASAAPVAMITIPNDATMPI
jgi:hypothetical protein